MIVLDGSALFAILLNEPDRDRCAAVLEREESILLSAASLSEILIVAASKNILPATLEMLDGLGPSILPLSEQRARAAADAYRQWGKGFNPARLNVLDSFAYALAIEHRCPLLFVGDDFLLTDVTPALA
jgi:ribonuclease VapC